MEGLVSQKISRIELERNPSNEADLVINISFVLYVDTGPEFFTHSGSATGAVKFVPSPYEAAGIPQADELEVITDQAPIFSHLLEKPTMESGP